MQNDKSQARGLGKKARLKVPALPRHREERSDAAIHGSLKSWIATAYGLAMTGLLRAIAMTVCCPAQTGLGQAVRHREERSDAAIHGRVKSWIATAFGLAMTAWIASLRSQWRSSDHAD